jgi:hypothetical protein
MPELGWLLFAALGIAGLGIALGMLLAPRLGRLGDRLAADDEEGSDLGGNDRATDR